MTKIKLCGLSRQCDIEWANELHPDYIGFVFAQNSKRYISPEKASTLKQALASEIMAVGVFVDETAENVAYLLNQNIIDIAQLHGKESDEYINRLRKLTEKPIIKAFRISSSTDIVTAENSKADFILLDSGAGTGTVFDWELIQNINRPYFIAGGLYPNNVKSAIETLHPYAVDVSSGIETNGLKDKTKMADFITAVRKED